MSNHEYKESKFWKIINLAGNAIGLNVVFLVSCIPVVTIGPAICGLYSGVRYMIRGDGWFMGFKAGFRKNFLRTGIATVVAIAMMFYLLLYFNTGLNFFMEGGSPSPMITYAVAMLFPAMICAALLPLNVFIPYTITDWLRNAVNLILKAPLQVLITAVFFWLPVFMVLFLTEIVYLGFLIFLGFYFSLIAFASTLILKDSIRDQLLLYKEEHPEDEDLYA